MQTRMGDSKEREVKILSDPGVLDWGSPFVDLPRLGFDELSRRISGLVKGMTPREVVITINHCPEKAEEREVLARVVVQLLNEMRAKAAGIVSTRTGLDEALQVVEGRRNEVTPPGVEKLTIKFPDGTTHQGDPIGATRKALEGRLLSPRVPMLPGATVARIGARSFSLMISGDWAEIAHDRK